MNLRSQSRTGVFRFGLFGLLLLLAPLASRAVILFRTANPAANTTAPTGGLSGSGWQFEGLWGAFLGTPISPHFFFLSAKHVGQAGASFTFDGSPYTLVREFGDPNSDLARSPTVAIESGYLTLTYFKVTTALDIQYAIEQSTDLVTWTTAGSIDEIIATQDNVQTIKAKVAMNGAPRLFLRLRITRS